MNCPNCFEPGYSDSEPCFRCGHTPRVGPGPETELPLNSGNTDQKSEKVKKMHGELISEEEAAEVRKKLGL